MNEQSDEQRTTWEHGKAPVPGPTFEVLILWGSAEAKVLDFVFVSLF